MNPAIQNISRYELIVNACTALICLIDIVGLYEYGGDSVAGKTIFVSIGILIVWIRKEALKLRYDSRLRGDYISYKHATYILYASSFSLFFSGYVLANQHLSELEHEAKQRSAPALLAQKELDIAKTELGNLQGSIGETNLVGAVAKYNTLKQEESLILNKASDKIGAFWEKKLNGVLYKDIMNSDCSPKQSPQGGFYKTAAGSVCSEYKQLLNDSHLAQIQSDIQALESTVQQSVLLSQYELKVQEKEKAYLQAVQSGGGESGNIYSLALVADFLNWIMGILGKTEFITQRHVGVGFFMFLITMLYVASIVFASEKEMQISFAIDNQTPPNLPPKPRKPIPKEETETAPAYFDAGSQSSASPTRASAQNQMEFQFQNPPVLEDVSHPNVVRFPKRETSAVQTCTYEAIKEIILSRELEKPSKQNVLTALRKKGKGCSDKLVLQHLKTLKEKGLLKQDANGFYCYPDGETDAA